MEKKTDGAGTRNGKSNFKEYKRNGASADRPARKRNTLKNENDEPVRKSVTRSEKNSSKGKTFEPKPQDGDKPYKSDRAESGERKPYAKSDRAGSAERKPYAKSEGDFKKSDRAGSAERKPYAKRDGADSYKKSDRAESGERKPYAKSDRAGSAERKPYAKRDGADSYKKIDRAESGERKPYAKSDRAGSAERKPYAKSEGDFKKSDKSGSAERKPYAKKDGAGSGARKPYAKGAGDYKKTDGAGNTERKPYAKSAGDKPAGEWKRPFPKQEERKPEERTADDWKKPFTKIDTKKPTKRKSAAGKGDEDDVKKSSRAGKRPFQKKEYNKPDAKTAPDADSTPNPYARSKRAAEPAGEIDTRSVRAKERAKEIESGVQSFNKPGKVSVSRSPEDAEQMPLNKYIAHSGVCSRRDAAALVKDGKVSVNGEVITDPGHKVKTTDEVVYSDKKLVLQKGMVYILLNKPKDYITTNDDPQGRKTVMELLMGQDADRLFPVGRLDRNTSGLLLITNDGDLTQRLSHPSFNIKKIYQVTLDKPLTKADFDNIMLGLELEDGKVIVDAMAYLDTKKELGLEIHTGRNRIVRRIFESLGYEVEKLDRVMYAGLTKKNLPRGKWRYLNEREIVLLKHFKS